MQQPTLPASRSGLLQGKSPRPALAPARTPPVPQFPGLTGTQHYPPCGKERHSSRFTVVNTIIVQSTTLRTLFSRKRYVRVNHKQNAGRRQYNRTLHQTNHHVLSPTGRKLGPLINPTNSLQAEEHLSLLLPASGVYRAGETKHCHHFLQLHKFLMLQSKLKPESQKKIFFFL